MPVLRGFLRLTLLISAGCGLALLFILLAARALPPTWEIAYSSRGRVMNQRAVLVMDVPRRFSLILAEGFYLQDAVLPFTPALSPNRRFVAWISTHDARLRLFDRQTNSVNDLGIHLEGGPPRWSPDSRYLAYQTMNNIRLIEIHQDGSSSTSIEMIAPNALVNVGQFEGWSWDGLSVAFSALYGNPSFVYLFAVEMDGELHRLSPFPGFAPAWSPNGQKLAFAASVREIESRVHIEELRNPQNRPMSIAMQTVTTRAYIEHLLWSPDGQHIAVTVYNPSSDRHDIYVIHLQAAQFSPLLLSLPLENKGVSWSPDSQWLAFAENLSSASGFNPSTDLYIVNINTQERQRLTHNDRIEVLLP